MVLCTTVFHSIQIPPPAKANEGQDKNYKGQPQQHFQPKRFIGQRKRHTGHCHRKSQHCHHNAIAHQQKPKSIHRNPLSLHAHQHIHHQTGAKAKSGISQVQSPKRKIRSEKGLRQTQGNEAAEQAGDCVSIASEILLAGFFRLLSWNIPPLFLAVCLFFYDTTGQTRFPQTKLQKNRMDCHQFAQCAPKNHGGCRHHFRFPQKYLSSPLFSENMRHLSDFHPPKQPCFSSPFSLK